MNPISGLIASVTGLPNELVGVVVEYQKPTMMEKIQGFMLDQYPGVAARTEQAWVLPAIRSLMDSLADSTDRGIGIEDAFFALVAQANQSSTGSTDAQFARETVAACIVHFSANPAGCLQRMAVNKVFLYQPVIGDSAETEERRLQAVRTLLGVE